MSCRHYRTLASRIGAVAWPAGASTEAAGDSEEGALTQHLRGANEVRFGSGDTVVAGLFRLPAPVLFGPAWQRAAGLSDEDLARRNPAVIFGGAFVLILVAAAELAMFLGEGATLAWGLGAGALTAVWVACALGVLYLFERRPLGLFLVNAGCWLVTFTAMGGLLTLW